METQSCPNIASSMAANSSSVARSLEVTSNKRQKTKAQKGEKNSVWSHFSRIYNDDGTDSDFVACDYCQKKYTHKGANYGTSTLRNHLNRCKEYPLNNLLRNDQSTIPFAKVDHSPSTLKVDQDMLKKAYARMIIVDELPFTFGEGEGFRHFIGLACPMFRIMSRTTVARDCLELYKSEKRKLKKSLTSSNQRLCLTTDQWTSIQNLSYMCVTAHYIDKDWKLNKKIISFNVLNSHKGVAIGGAVESCLKEWGVKSVFTLTVDNASSNDTAVLSLKKTLKKSALVLDGECFHVRCCAHIVNLIVRDGLKEVESSISNIRSAIRYIRSSPQRASKFKQHCEEEGLPSKCALVLDVPTRWNYTYHMLKSALKFQRAFLLMELKEDLAKDLRDEVPSERDWDNARVLVSFLQTFYEVTNKFSGSKYVTSNIHFHEAHAVENILIEWSGSEDPIMSAMAKKMKAKFDKYWSPFDKMNYLLLVAVVMDPRYKLIYVGFTYNEIYPLDKVQNLVEKLNNLLKRLYAFYLESSPFYSDTNDVVNEPVQESMPTSTTCVANRNQQRFFKYMEQVGQGPKSELERYLGEICEKNSSDFDILAWWKANEHRYPVLSQMARDVLAIPISTVASESAFSTIGRVLDSFRSSLSPRLVEALLCAQDWLRTQPKPMEVEARLEEIEELESVITFNNDEDESVYMDVSDLEADEVENVTECCRFAAEICCRMLPNLLLNLLL